MKLGRRIRVRSIVSFALVVSEAFGRSATRITEERSLLKFFLRRTVLEDHVTPATEWHKLRYILKNIIYCRNRGEQGPG